MRACFVCGLKKLGRKKVSGFLLGACIAVTAALSVNALTLILKMDAVFDTAYEEMGGAHLCCLWDNEMFSTDYVREYLEGLQGGFAYQITEHTKTVMYMEKDGIRLSNGILLELPETIPENMLSPKLPEGEAPDMPGKGQVWITKKLANILHLGEGDTFFLKFGDESVPVEAAGIVADTVFGSSGTNVYRMWCGYGTLEDFPAAENHAVSYLELKFDTYNPETEQKFIRETEAYFDMPLGRALYSYDKIKNGYMMTYRMVGAVLSFVSLVLVAAIAALTGFLVKSDLDEDVRSIGIYRSLGITGMQIMGVYLVCYGVTGFVGAGFGSAAGSFFSKKILAGVLSSIGIEKTARIGTEGYLFLSGVLVFSAVLLLVLVQLPKIRRLNASYAIRKGEWQPRGKGRKKGCAPRVSFEFFYALRGIRNKKLRYGYIAGVSLVLSGLVVVCMGCLSAVRNIDREPEAWGFTKTDIYVTSLESTPVSAVIGELEKDPGVDYTYGANKVYVSYRPGEGRGYQSITTELYEIPWKEEIRDYPLYGSRPETENQIGVGLGLVEEYGFGVGDKIELMVNGEKGEYEITEIFQTLSDSGRVFRMVTDNLDDFVKADGKYGDYMLVLKDSDAKWEYAQELTERYGGKFAFIASKSNGENFSGVLTPAAFLILTLLTAVILLVTMNLTFLLVRREQKQIGLLKAVGMDSRQVLKIYVWRNCLSAAAGSCLGVLAGVYIVPNLLSPYAKNLGLAKFPFVPSPSGIFMGLLLPSFCMFLGTWGVMKTVRRVSVKQLVSE